MGLTLTVSIAEGYDATLNGVSQVSHKTAFEKEKCFFFLIYFLLEGIPACLRHPGTQKQSTFQF